MRKLILMLFLYCIASMSLYCQYGNIKLDGLTTISHSQVASSIHSTLGFRTTYMSFKGFYLSGIYDISLRNPDINTLNALSMTAGYQFHFDEHKHLLVYGNYLYKASTKRISEHNMGIMATYYIPKWEFSLGTNFKRYKLNDEYPILYDNTTDIIMKEKPGFTYRIKYYIWDQTESRFSNAYLALTNFDWVTIEQETNPFIGAGYWHEIKKFSDMKFVAEVYYIASGFNNIRVNYYGISFKAGISWQIDL